MLNKVKVHKALKEYFETKGRVLTPQEYARETDTPVRVQEVKRIFGTWARMENTIMATDNKAAPTSGLNVDALLKERNESANAAANQWKEASENQDVKARREAEAQAVAETLARNAATPEGANANKIAIGGKLAHEQQDYSAMGATVKTDASSLEQTVVDTKPEVVTTGNDDPKTPYQLRDAVASEGVSGGTPDVGTATAGGSTGEASISTVQALGGETADKETIEDGSKRNNTTTTNSRVPADETKAAPTKK